MRRLLAILGAAAMIAGALALRARVRGDEGDARGGSARGTLVCVTELRAVCEALRADHPDVTVRVEDAGVTAAALRERTFDRSTTPVDVWLTIDPYPELVAAGRTAAAVDPVLEAPSAALARSPLAIVAFDDRATALQATCRSGLTWACIGDAAGRPWSDVGGQPTWGTVRAGLAPPERSATGLLSVAQGTGQRLGTTDYASNDLSDPAVSDWLPDLAANVSASPGVAPVDQLLAQGVAVFPMAGGLEASAGPAVQRSARREQVTLTLPQPVATADVVAVRARGSQDAASLEALVAGDATKDALAREGWRVPGRPAAAGVGSDPLPADNGLPNGGVLLALENAWSEVR